jgi:hypothetical protein
MFLIDDIALSYNIILLNREISSWEKKGRKSSLSSFSLSMSERSELRRRREERMENGVKNLKGARLFPKTFSNQGFVDAFVPDWVVSRILCKIGDRCILPFFTSVDKGK